MKDLALESIKYIELNDELWILPSSVALLKGKQGNNYSNWAVNKHTDLLDGNELRLTKGSLEWIEAIHLFKKKYKGLLIATSEDVRLIDITRAKAYLSTDRPQHAMSPILKMNNTKLNLVSQEVPTITSLDFAQHLDIDHPSVLRNINRYKAFLESFDPLLFQVSEAKRDNYGKWLPKEVPDYYKLTEPQAYFLATLSRNTPQVVELKKWLINTFMELKKQTEPGEEVKALLSYLPGNWEGLVQSILCYLSSYTDHPYRQEVSLVDKGRVDIIMSDTEALEIKNHVISPCHIKELTFNKGYWYQIKQVIPEFQTLYITSTKGITEDALALIEILKPEIQYIPLKNLFETLAPKKDYANYLFPGN